MGQCTAVELSTGLAIRATHSMASHPSTHVAVVQGGYKAFWKAHAELCEGGYTPMDHPEFSQELKVGGVVGGQAAGRWGRRVCLEPSRHLILVLGGTLGGFAALIPETHLLPTHPYCTSLLSPARCPAGVPQRGEKGVGAHHPHLCAPGAPAPALLPPAPEHGGGRGGRGSRGG